jgi:ABC-type Fe3+/spermidine/putrescine transport system ATPase subunit
MTNLFEGLAHRTAGGYVVETAIGAFPLLEPREGKLTVLLRPDSVHLDGSGSVQLEGRLVSCSFRGSTCQAKIDLHGEALTIEFPASVQLPPVGERVVLSFEPAQAVQIFSR